MNKQLKIIDERELLGKNFRIYGTMEEPLFLAKDVAAWIEHSDVSTMLRNIDEDEKVTNIVCTHGGNQSAWFLTEEGLYEILMQSRKPIAKEFKKRIKEILKAIRKHGGYLTPQKVEEALLNPDTIIQLATQLKEEREKRFEIEKQIEKDKAKVIFAEALETAKNTILIGELAKLLKQNGLNIGQNRLFEKLRKEGYLGNKGDYYNLPTQKSMNLELFEIKVRTVNNPDGSLRVTKTTKVTGKGQIYFINKFQNELIQNKAS